MRNTLEEKKNEGNKRQTFFYQITSSLRKCLQLISESDAIRNFAELKFVSQKKKDLIKSGLKQSLVINRNIEESEVSVKN